MKALYRNACWAALWLAVALPGWAVQFQVRARAQPARVSPETGYAEIIAEIRDESGQPAPDGTEVLFASTLGTIVPTAQTQGGLARSRLTSSTSGTAQVTVAALGATAQVIVEFTDEAGGGRSESRAVRISGGYVAYNMERQIVVAADRARLEQGRIVIEAESLQYDVSVGTVRAQRGVRVANGSKALEAERLSYDVSSKNGLLMRTRPKIARASFQASTLIETEATWAQEAAFKAMTADSDRSWVVARQVIVYPREKIQFIRAQFYLQGQRLMALPYHQIPLNSFQSRQGLVNQVLSFTSSGGINLDFPVYYSTTSARSGSLHIRRSGYPGIYGEGLSLGLQEEYDLGRMRGVLSLDNLTSSTRGLRWEHHQGIGETTADISFSHYRYDSRFPAMSYGNAFIRRDLGTTDLTITASGSRYGAGTDWSTTTAFRWPQAAVGKTAWHYGVATDLRVGTGPGLMWMRPYQSRGVRTELGLDLDLNSPTWQVASRTTATTTFRGRAGVTSGATTQNVEAKFSLRRSLGSSSSAAVTYSQLFGGQDYWSFGRRRLDGNVFVQKGDRWSASAYFSRDLGTSDMFATLGGNYALPFERRDDGAPRWRLEANMGHSRYSSFSMTDSRIALSREIGNYVASLVYSPSGAAGYGPYGGGFGFNQGRHFWLELSMGGLSF